MAGLVAEPAFGTGCAHGWSLGSPEMPPDPGCGPARCGLMGTQQSKGTFFFQLSDMMALMQGSRQLSRQGPF